MAEAQTISFNFEKLKLWQEAMQWTVKIQTTKVSTGKSDEQQAWLATQEAAREVPILIAEGKNYYLNRIFQSFLRRSKAKLYRTATLLLLLQSLGHLDAKETKPLLAQSYSLARQIGGLLRYLAKEEAKKTSETKENNSG